MTENPERTERWMGSGDEETRDARSFALYAVDRSPVPMVATQGPSHTIRYANAAFCSLCGLKRKEITGLPFADAVLGSHGNGSAALLDRVYATGVTESLADQVRTSPFTPTTRWSYLAWAVRGDTDTPVGVMLQVTDTSAAYRERRLIGDVAEALLLSDVRQHEQVEEADAGVQRLQISVRETDHRAKNGLQLLGALLELVLQENSTSVPITALNPIRAHVQILASLHQALSQNIPTAELDTTASVRGMLDELTSTWRRLAGGAEIRSTADEVNLPVRMVSALATVVSELVNNALKHGGKRVDVVSEERDSTIRVTISDDGPGFPPGFDPVTDARLGLELIGHIVNADLHGLVDYGNRPGGGACVLVTFCAGNGVRSNETDTRT